MFDVGILVSTRTLVFRGYLNNWITRLLSDEVTITDWIDLDLVLHKLEYVYYFELINELMKMRFAAIAHF